ncbi:MAG: non-canonical purine NTP pyrophosphatase, RdgB/HAM1 family [Synergistaceae bacterium]|jgi:XTP/dITP diphosphohydrolase|nr:non-canonical purine NTP pyrophosphatase, RdgB/HAM1 family [Synergistaceae bacterium]
MSFAPSDDKKISMVLASGNSHKYAEFVDFFKSFSGIELLYAGNFASSPGEIEESGLTYEANALIKARAWADFAGIPAIADDSGIEVRCLDWRPGVLSARAAPGDDAGRVAWLLDSMSGSSDRRACFAACLVIAAPLSNARLGRDYFSIEARCWGNVAYTPSGVCGFGYDPVFVPDGYDRTFSDLGPGVKSKISHRGIAVQGVAQILPDMLKYFSTCDKLRASSDEEGY